MPVIVHSSLSLQNFSSVKFGAKVTYTAFEVY